MKTRIAITAVFLIVAGAVLVHGLAERQLKLRLKSYVEENCKDCTLNVQSLRLSPLGGSVTLIGTHLIWGNPQATEVDAQASRITVQMTVGKLFEHRVRVEKLQIESPDVTVTEGDLKTPKSEAEEKEKSLWTFVVENTAVTGGAFKYVRVFKSRRATIHVKDISATVGSVGTTSSLRERATIGEATGRLENSGNFILKITTPLFARRNPIDVDLQMAGQNLSDMNPFFHVEDGILLSGVLHQGRTSVALLDRKLTGSTEARYGGLDIHFEKTKDRGATSAFFSNLGKSIKLNRDKPKPAKNEERLSMVKLDRKKTETLIQFILHGMKDSALKVATLEAPRGNQ